ncbi:MAG: DUF4300 family protein, partial [Clostridia bacterium]|nr:DUF4300 family protein [Clostridia bacterium]
MKKIAGVLLAAAVIFLTGCGAGTREETEQLPLAAYLTDDGIIEDVCAALEKNGAKNVDVFKAWVRDFSDTSVKDAGLTKRWVRPGELEGDPYACADYWEKTHDFPDANCRMTAMLLMGDLLTIDDPEKAYDGTYLMM